LFIHMVFKKWILRESQILCWLLIRRNKKNWNSKIKSILEPYLVYLICYYLSSFTLIQKLFGAFHARTRERIISSYYHHYVKITLFVPFYLLLPSIVSRSFRSCLEYSSITSVLCKDKRNNYFLTPPPLRQENYKRMPFYFN